MTSSQITVSGLVTKSFFGTDLDQAVMARFNQANSSRELPCGRKINYLPAADDGGTSDGNLAGARRLVEEEHVFAIVPTISPIMESPTATYLNQQQVPVVGWGITAPYCTTDPSSDYFFGINGCVGTPPNWDYSVNMSGYSAALMLQLQGKGGAAGKSAAAIGQNFQGAETGIQQVAAEFASVGFKMVYAQANMPATVSDFTPYVQALMTSNGGQPPDIITIQGQPGNALGLARALAQAGYKGIVTHSFYAPQLTAAAKGQTALSLWATPESTAPAMKQIVDALHGAGVSQIGFEETAYLSADMFVQILKKVGPDLTPQRFQQVASHFTYQIPGVIGPTVYPASFFTGPSCGEMLTSDGTKWTINAPYKCFPTVLKKQGTKWVQVQYPGGVG